MEGFHEAFLLTSTLPWVKMGRSTSLRERARGKASLECFVLHDSSLCWGEFPLASRIWSLVDRLRLRMEVNIFRNIAYVMPTRAKLPYIFSTVARSIVHPAISKN